MPTKTKKKSTPKKASAAKKKHKPAKKIAGGDFRSAISIVRDGVRKGEDVAIIEKRVAKAFPQYPQKRVAVDVRWHIKHPEYLDIGQKKQKTA